MGIGSVEGIFDLIEKYEINSFESSSIFSSSNNKLTVNILSTKDTIL